MTAAAVGFIIIILVLSWLSIRLVNTLPTAFSSLASLAESINQKSVSLPESDDVVETTSLIVTSNTTLISSGEKINLSWDIANVPGTYTFSYACLEGVVIDLVDNEAGSKNVSCDTNYNVGDKDSLTLSVKSEKKRYENISYTISFLKTSSDTPTATGTASFTVVNSQINDALAEEDTEKEDGLDTEKPEVLGQSTTTATTTPVKKDPVYKQEFIYAIPVSDPKGNTDLATRFLYSGNIVGNSFFTGPIYQNKSGAIQFEVKNYGTKTSSDWTYTVSLPSGGDYTSPKQNPLKPNERAVITLGFPTTDKSEHTFRVEIDEPTDRTTINDRFAQTVKFAR